MGEEIEFDLTRESYNSFVQMAQREAMTFRMEHRIKQTDFDDGRIDGEFQVFWDRWQTLGREINAMTPDCSRTIYPERWERIKADAAHELAKG
jgi:hypothetical protein